MLMALRPGLGPSEVAAEIPDQLPTEAGPIRLDAPLQLDPAERGDLARALQLDRAIGPGHVIGRPNRHRTARLDRGGWTRVNVVLPPVDRLDRRGVATAPTLLIRADFD